MNVNDMIESMVNILKACGADPKTTTDENGGILIKVNAPTIGTEDAKK